MIAIVILAAGQSSRMRGTDKLCEDVNGTPLLRLQTERALATGAQVFVALPHDAPERAALIADLGVSPVWIDDPAQGIGVTLRHAVAALPEGADFMVMLPDLVAITVDDLNAVIQARVTEPQALIWRATTADGHPGHPVLFDQSLKPAFAVLQGDDGAQKIITAQKAATCLVPLPDTRARYDLDTPEDWAAFRATTS